MRALHRRIRYGIVLPALALGGLALVPDEGAVAAPPKRMPGMTSGTTMSAKQGATPVVKGLKPISAMPGMPMVMPITPIGQTTWQGMKIAARATAPSTFILLESGKQVMVKPTGKDSFHLMVMLDDARIRNADPVLRRSGRRSLEAAATARSRSSTSASGR